MGVERDGGRERWGGGGRERLKITVNGVAE